MKGKAVKKMLACLITGVLLAGCISGCGKADTGSDSTSEASSSGVASTGATASGTENTGEAQGQEITYPLEEKVHLTLARVDESQVTANATDLGETPFGQAWQEATGVELEIMQLADATALNLLYAGGELPDLIWYNGYTGGAEKAIKDKIIEPLNDYMEYAPDLQAVLDNNSLLKKSVTTADGDIIGFPFVQEDDYLKTPNGLIVRQDWLDELEMEIPQTADELYEVLKAFKEKKGAEVPFTVSSSDLLTRVISCGMITSPFGMVRGDFYQIDGKVHYGYAEKEYKDVLVYLNKLYEEGLLDPNFQSVDGNTKWSNVMNGISGVTYGPAGGGIGNMLQTMEGDPNFDLSGFGPLVANRGDVPMSTQYNSVVSGVYVIITPACKDKEAAAKFLNYGYTEEGNRFFNFGIEGVSYTMENGVPTYTDLITNNPDGLTMQLALAQYTRAWMNGPFVQDKGYLLQYAGMPQQQAALESWTNSDAAKYEMPPVTVAEVDTSEYSRLSGDISTYVSEMSIQYISGLKSLDTFESEYLATLESMGVDRMIELQQTALDNFNAR